jgi:hypothetical protein
MNSSPMRESTGAFRPRRFGHRDDIRDEVGNIPVTRAERCGPSVTAPIRNGFGSTVWAQVIPFELQGVVHRPI